MVATISVIRTKVLVPCQVVKVRVRTSTTKMIAAKMTMHSVKKWDFEPFLPKLGQFATFSVKAAGRETNFGNFDF